MKKGYILVAISLMFLVACSAKKSAEKNNHSTETLTSAAPVWNKTEEERNQLVTKKISFPEKEGVTQTQIVTYQGKEWVSLTMEQVQPANDEIKNALAEVGAEETQKALDEALEKDEKYQQAKNLAGFSYKIELTPEQQLKFTTTYDLKKLKLDEMDKLEYFKGSNLRSILEFTPAKYIETREDAGAKIE